MKSSVSPRAVVLSLLAILTTIGLQAQDTIVLKNNQRQPGEVLGIKDGRIRIKRGPVESSLPLDQISSVVMEPPKAFQDALNAWSQGDANKTLTLLTPLVTSFRGVPTPWAERASALIGQVYLETGNIPEAEKAFTAFQTAYPNATSATELGLARLAVEKKDFATAKSKLEPIIASASGILLAESGKNAEFGQAYYLMGQIREAEGDASLALQDYLTAVTIFYEDDAIVAKAQARANQIKEKNVIVP